jgi:hypothetical protein
MNLFVRSLMPTDLMAIKLATDGYLVRTQFSLMPFETGGSGSDGSAVRRIDGNGGGGAGVRLRKGQQEKTCSSEDDAETRRRRSTIIWQPREARDCHAAGPNDVVACSLKSFSLGRTEPCSGST